MLNVFALLRSTILCPPSSPGFRAAPSPTFKASKGGQRRTFGLFSSPLFALRVLSTTCVAKNAPLAPPDSNGTENRGARLCRIGRAQAPDQPQQRPSSTRFDSPFLVKPTLNLELGTRNWRNASRTSGITFKLSKIIKATSSATSRARSRSSLPPRQDCTIAHIFAASNDFTFP